ncbi:MAG TPA: two-component regulator propeller domain-containing protein [Pyrinomonadaceae bacterium]|nr:two-component regulator propeller domain-containing protein [Pyrinomonadaceae bacterium]
MIRLHPGRCVIVLGMLLTGTVLAGCPSAFALDPRLDVSQYAHTAWRVDDGFTKSEITAIGQTADGYLWLGTELGLYRFDGVKNVLWNPPAAQSLPSNWIMSLLGTPDGTLWIGTANGLASWKDGRLTQHPELAGHYIFKILEDHEGTIWASGITVNIGKLCAIRNSTVQCYGEDGIFGRGAFNLYADSHHNLWAGVKDGLWRWQPGPPRFYPLPGEPSGIQSLGEDSNGSLLVGWNRSIHRFVDGKTQTYSPLTSAHELQTRRILRDRQGNIWIGTLDRGLVHVHDGRADTFTTANGLSGENVNALFEDREGNIWVITTSGLDRFHDFAVATYSANQGLSSSYIYSVLADRKGSIWLAGRNALTKWHNWQISTINPRRGKLDPFIPSSIFQDAGERIWVATNSELGYVENDRFVPLISMPGPVTGITQDADGDLWIANEHAGLFQVRHGNVIQQLPWSRLGHSDHVSMLLGDPLHGGVWLGFFLGGIAYFDGDRIQTTYAAEQGLAPGRVSDLLLDRDSTLWIATEGGLSRLKGGQVTTLTRKNGLPCDAIHWLREDDAHAYWLFTSCGLVRIERAELEAVANAVNQDVNTKRLIAAAVLDSSDGVKSLASGNHCSPQVVKSTDGRFWFTASYGVNVVDPGHLPFNKLPPPVHIEQFIADRTIYETTANTGERLRLPPLSRDLQIDYTALSLVTPERIQFRYLLEGRDTEWQEAGHRRQAFYTDLRPGNYRFRVMAANNNGVWNETGAYFDFSIAPAYYQTRWFRISAAIVFLLIVGGLYQLRLRQMARQMRGRMEGRLAERERIARDLHDTFLQSVHGLILKFDAAAQQLPASEPVRHVMEEALERADQVIAEGRDRVKTLRNTSASIGDLPAAFTRVVEESSHDRKMTFKAVVEGKMRRLNPIVMEESYAIGREALINALTHSGARNVEAEITYDRRQFRLRIRDDGRGIDTRILAAGGRPDHFGLVGMRERADRINAQLNLWSAAGTGTEIELIVPDATAYQKVDRKASGSWFRFR